MKRIVSMFVLIAMVTCFFGCGNKNENILTTLSTETDPSSDTSFFSDTNSSEYSSEIGTLSDGSIAPIVNPNSGNSSSGNIDPPNNNSNNTSGKVTNPKNPTNPPSNVKPGEYLGKDKPLMSKLPHELNPAQYHYTMTPADFFTKTGNEYSSTTAILKRFNVAKYYDNNSLNGDDIVTKSELVKLLGVVFDNDPTIKQMYEDNQYANATYVKYAETLSLIAKGTINSNNQAKSANKKELFDILACASYFLLDENTINELDSKYSGLYWQSKSEAYLRECLSKLGFGSYSNDYLSTDVVNKSYLNEIILKLYKEYGLIHYNAKPFGGEKVKTDINKMPSNYHLYSYMLESIPNYVYELPMYCNDINEFRAPYDMFCDLGHILPAAQSEAEQYLDIVLNVDYRTIDTQDFYEKILHCDILDDLTYEDVQKYVDYLKANEIVVKGHGKAYSPIVYSTEFVIFIRSNVVFEISGKTNKNVIFGDNNVTYLKNSYNMYMDVALYYRVIGSTAPWWNNFMATCYKHTPDIIVG